MNRSNYGLFPVLIINLMFIISLIAFVIGIKYKKKHRELKHLYIYPLATIIETAIAFPLRGKNILGLYIDHDVNLFAIHAFIVIEFVCIYLFFLKTTIIAGYGRKILPFFFAAFFCLYISGWINKNNFLKNYMDVYFLDSCFILFPCFVYLFQLFNKPPTLNLLNEPSFWFNAGILIYFTLTLPAFFMADYFQTVPLLVIINDINFIGYSIIFSFLIRAYLCEPKATI